jgi:hypothetical protein
LLVGGAGAAYAQGPAQPPATSPTAPVEVGPESAPGPDRHVVVERPDAAPAPHGRRRAIAPAGPTPAAVVPPRAIVPAPARPAARAEPTRRHRHRHRAARHIRPDPAARKAAAPAHPLEQFAARRASDPAGRQGWENPAVIAAFAVVALALGGLVKQFRDVLRGL